MAANCVELYKNYCVNCATRGFSECFSCKILDNGELSMYKDKAKTRLEILRSMNLIQYAQFLNWEFGHCEWCDPEKWTVEDCTDFDCMKCIVCWLNEKIEPEEFRKQIEEHIKEAKNSLKEEQNEC